MSNNPSNEIEIINVVKGYIVESRKRMRNELVEHGADGANSMQRTIINCRGYFSVADAEKALRFERSKLKIHRSVKITFPKMTNDRLRSLSNIIDRLESEPPSREYVVSLRDNVDIDQAVNELNNIYLKNEGYITCEKLVTSPTEVNEIDPLTLQLDGLPKNFDGSFLSVLSGAQKFEMTTQHDQMSVSVFYKTVDEAIRGFERVMGIRVQGHPLKVKFRRLNSNEYVALNKRKPEEASLEVVSPPMIKQEIKTEHENLLDEQVVDEEYSEDC